MSECTGGWLDKLKNRRLPSNKLSSEGKRRWRVAERNRMAALIMAANQAGEIGCVEGFTVYTTELPSKYRGRK